MLTSEPIVLRQGKVHRWPCQACRATVNVEGSPGRYKLQTHIDLRPGEPNFGETCLGRREVTEQELQTLLERSP